jgi:hypothetical protein
MEALRSGSRWFSGCVVADALADDHRTAGMDQHVGHAVGPQPAFEDLDPVRTVSQRAEGASGDHPDVLVAALRHDVPPGDDREARLEARRARNRLVRKYLVRVIGKVPVAAHIGPAAQGRQHQMRGPQRGRRVIQRFKHRVEEQDLLAEEGRQTDDALPDRALQRRAGQAGIVDQAKTGVARLDIARPHRPQPG